MEELKRLEEDKDHQKYIKLLEEARELGVVELFIRAYCAGYEKGEKDEQSRENV